MQYAGATVAQLFLNPVVSGSTLNSYWPHVQMSLDKTLKPDSRAVIFCLEAVKQQFSLRGARNMIIIKTRGKCLQIKLRKY